jgi:hypothetical protein
MGYAMEVSPLMPPQDGNELLAVHFTVLQVESRPVLVDTVVLTVIRTSTGELLIGQTEVEATTGDHGSWKQCGRDTGCSRSLLFARIQSLLASARARLTSFTSRLPFGKGCHKGAHADAKPGHRKTGGHHHHHHGHHGMHHHGWRRAFFRAVRFIIVPALLGVMAGLAASAIGMLVGQLIVFLWLHYRRSTNKTRRSAPNTVERGTSSEKEALMASESAEELPPYSDEDAANASSTADAK